MEKEHTLPLLVCKTDLPLVQRRKNATQNLGYDPERIELPVVREVDMPLPTATGQSTLSDMYGCGHPERDECLFCSVDRYADMIAKRDPFLNPNTLKARISALRAYPFQSVQEAEDGYTYFNSFIEWHRIIAIHDFFKQHYPVIRDQLTAVKVRFIQLNNRDEDRRYTGIRTAGQANRYPDKPSNTSNAPSIPDKEYCSWIYTPPASTRYNRQTLSLHYVYAEVPILTEALRYLELVFAPPPPLYQAIMNAVRRSVSQGHIPGHSPKHNQANYRVVQRRVTSNQFRVRKKPSQRTFALLQHTNKRYEEEREKEAEDTSAKLEDTGDQRTLRNRRVSKHAGISEKFRRGFPVMIFVSDTSILDKRIDYQIRQDERYVNVFHLTTPITPPAPVGGEWGPNAASSEELSELSEDPSSSS